MSIILYDACNADAVSSFLDYSAGFQSIKKGVY